MIPQFTPHPISGIYGDKNRFNRKLIEKSNIELKKLGMGLDFGGEQETHWQDIQSD